MLRESGRRLGRISRNALRALREASRLVTARSTHIHHRGRQKFRLAHPADQHSARQCERCAMTSRLAEIVPRLERLILMLSSSRMTELRCLRQQGRGGAPAHR
jgi:hypothetical protein